ncbi:hypothetical protein GQ43DRAFT_362490 [Delitschia confertaspora ATCC 74209]|uniref:Late endosomal/lysosomal adaptor and MAPK and MTOR activator-domain-containing protein n=1 Tax=Delitschia confertaspora ATCC 74209 TaxID=1513339 RepID=A0A9P4JXL1_9PLEO|nr:hypothetical protein GQ43DRAFT_362490 [Delitschia confertaspora ATCC 74209]
MGICASCLSLGRRSSDSDVSQHLLSDPYHQYGSINASAPHGILQPDPEEIRRQRDALERICAQTSDKLIDVSQSAYTDEGSKMTSEFPRLFNERFPESKSAGSRPSSADPCLDGDEESWVDNVISNKEGDEGNWEHVVSLKSGVLVVDFDKL